jgi:hypothetical protein
MVAQKPFIIRENASCHRHPSFGHRDHELCQAFGAPPGPYLSGYEHEAQGS